MKEFGSDFHYIDTSDSENTLLKLFPNAICYANGRQALQAIILHCKWKRIWLPNYFCYDIIEAIKKTAIQVCFYNDTPLADDCEEVPKISYQKGDVLLRMNYFGIRAFRNNDEIPISVIEDHSHDLIGNWVKNSNADWCIASIRKTLPIPEGGLLWSPKANELPDKPNQIHENSLFVDKRRRAMLLKKKYLQNKLSDKNTFRGLFIETEANIEELASSAMTEDTNEYLKKFDIKLWYKQKENNWTTLSNFQSDRIVILKKEMADCNYFSWVILFSNNSERNKIRRYLINKSIYPAILWQIPDNKAIAKSVGDRMLSIPCDGRYTLDDMLFLKRTIVKALKYV